MAQTEYAVRLQHVTKTFGPVVANKDVSLSVRRGEILALLGENGSGKTTLMNMIAGIYFPDEGEIYVGDKAATIRSPRDALDLGIGMIHQHFKLVDVFTATENIALSMGGGRFDLKKVHEKARAICEKYQFALDLDQKVYEMSVSQKQTLEIVKVLFRGADILILDEPTAVLTPQETEKLFAVMRNMKADGKAVVIITHKLHEVLSVSDRVAILRKGEYVGTVETATATESSLTEMMVGQKVELNINRTTPQDPTRRLAISHLSVRSPEGTNVLDDVSFDVYGGEILGIAGISGNGQKELLEAIAGLQHTESGSDVKFFAPGEEDKPMELLGKSPKNQTVHAPIPEGYSIDQLVGKIVDVQHPNTGNARHLVQVVVVGNDGAAVFPAEPQQLHVHFFDVGIVLFHYGNGDFQFLLHPVQHVQPPAAPGAAQTVAAVRDVPQLRQHEGRNDDFSFQKAGLQHVQNSAVDDDGGIQHLAGHGLLPGGQLVLAFIPVFRNLGQNGFQQGFIPVRVTLAAAQGGQMLAGMIAVVADLQAQIAQKNVRQRAEGQRQKTGPRRQDQLGKQRRNGKAAQKAQTGPDDLPVGHFLPVLLDDGRGLHAAGQDRHAEGEKDQRAQQTKHHIQQHLIGKLLENLRGNAPEQRSQQHGQRRAQRFPQRRLGR